MASDKVPPNDVSGPFLSLTDLSVRASSQEALKIAVEAAEESFPASDPPVWASLRAEAEPDALLDTLQHLEAALASAPFRWQEWAPRALDDMRAVRQVLGRHPVTDDVPDSFLADMDLTPGLARRGIKLWRDHADLLIQARMLLVVFGHEAENDPPDFALIRRRFDRLLRGLRQQELLEKDLIFESLCLDIGTGD
jgi:hypothetical protein